MPTTITISEFQPDPSHCNFQGSTAKLRRYYNQDWTDVDGVFHAEGQQNSSTDFFDEINCSLSGNTITVPAFSATPTDNPQTGSNVQETWQLWDQAGTARNVIFEGFIPSANPVITFGALLLLNRGQTLFESDAITRLDSWIQSYINIVIGVLRFATSVIAGWVRLSVAAANVSDPIAVGDNDPRVNVSINVISPAYGAVGNGITDDSAAVAAALAAISVFGGTLFFPAGYTFRLNTKLLALGSNVLWSGYGATLRFQGANTSRLMTLSGDNNTFAGLTFSANNSQPYGALIYIADNVVNPKFIDCTFKDLSATVHGTNESNQVYTVAISPYGVTNFLFRNCLFTNLTSTNTGSPPTSGWGFVGGVNLNNFTGTNPEVWGNGATPQTVITSGLVDGCVFDTIKTILPTGLTDSEIDLYDDGDAIRSGGVGVGYDGTGVNQLNVRVANCRFTNVSKRAIKFSGVSGLTASNNEIIADQGMYSMQAGMKVYGNSIIDGTKILSPGKVASLTRSGTTVTATVTAHGYSTGERIAIIGATQPEYNGRFTITVTGANTFTYTIVGAPTSPATGTIRATKPPRVGLLAESMQNSVISNTVMNAGGFFLEFNDTTASVPQTNLVVNGFACDNLDNGGIIPATNNASSAYGLKIANGYLGCTGDNSAGITTPLANSGTQSEFEIKDVKVRNGNVKMSGRNGSVDGLTIVIDRAGFNGPVNGPGVGVLELGSPGATDYNIFRDIHVNISSILSTYLTAPRTALITISGDNTTTQNLSVRVPGTAALSTALPHIDFYGSDCVVDGVSYYGPGYMQAGVTLATNGSVYRNLSRLGIGQAATSEFILTNANGTNLMFQNVSDQRTTTATINMSGGGPNLIDGVASLSSMFELGTTDVYGTVKNSFRSSNILRREASTTVTADAQVASVLADTIFLTAAAPHVNVTLAAPTTSDLSLVIIATTGTSTIAVVPGTTVVFVGINPTFGTASGNVRSMTFRSSSSGVWYETGRAVVP